MKQQIGLLLSMVLAVVMAGGAGPSAGPTTPGDAPDAVVARARDLVAGNQFEAAIEALGPLLVGPTTAGSAEARHLAGYCHQVRGRFKEAIEQYDAVLATTGVEPALRAKTLMWKGNCQGVLKQTAAALETLRQAMDAVGASPETRNNSGLFAAYLLVKADRLDEAIAMFEGAAAVEEVHPWHVATACIGISNVKRKRGDFAAALAWAEKAAAVEGAGQKAASARNALADLRMLAGPDDPFIVRPYTTRVTSDTAEVRWVSKGPCDSGTVVVEAAGEPVAKVDATAGEIEREGAFQAHLARVNGLEPGRSYRLEARVGDATADTTVTTPDPADETFTFCVIGDTQTQADVHRRIAPLVAATEPRFVLHVGDLVEGGPDWPQWKSQLFDPGEPYLRLAPLYPTRGNHDGGPYFPRLFGLDPWQHYSFDVGNVHVAVLDSFGPAASGKARAEQAAWLDRDLAATKAAWKIVAVHDPMINSDTYNDWWGEQDFLPLVEKHGVDLVLSGHHHLYRRYLPIAPPGRPEAKPVIHVTTGGAGGTLGGDYASPLVAKQAAVHHFLTFRVAGDKLSMIATDIDGQELDRLELVKKDGRPSEELQAAAIDRSRARVLAPLAYRFLAAHSTDRVPMRLTRPEGDPARATLSIEMATLPGGRPDLVPGGDDLSLRLESPAAGDGWRIASQACDLRADLVRVVATWAGPGEPAAERSIPVTATIRLGNRDFPPLQLVIVPKAAAAIDVAEQRAAADRLLAAHRFEDAARRTLAILPHVAGSAAAEVQEQYALCLTRLYRHGPAIAAWRQLLEMPAATVAQRVGGRLMIGSSEALLGRHQDAIVSYSSAAAIAEAPRDSVAEARLRTGYALHKLGHRDRAIATFESVCDVPGINPATYQTALCAAGGILQMDHRYREALELYERAAAYGEHGGWTEVTLNRIKECRTALGGDREFYFAPYVSLVSETGGSIFWISLEDAVTGEVVVTGGGKTFTPPVERKKMADQPADRQRATLSGLTPDTLYEYEIRCGGKTAKGSFHTARPRGKPVRFVVLGDTQTGWERHEKLAPRIAAERPDFVMHVGDCVERGESWDEWKVQMFDPGRDYLDQAGFWVARGNHDGGPYFPILFGREGAPWQTFTFGDIDVFVLESTAAMGGSNGAAQQAWLTEQFQNSTARWRLVALHHPLFHTANGDRLVGQETFRPLIERLAPDIVINGHYHVYTRLLPMGLPGAKPLVNIITGGGGGRSSFSTLTPLAEREIGKINHYCLFEIAGDRLTMTAKAVDGVSLDSFTLVKKEGRFQDEVMEKAVTPQLARSAQMVLHDLLNTAPNTQELTGRIRIAGDRAFIVLDPNVLDRDKLPPGVGLGVASQAGSAWEVRPQRLDLKAGPLAFEAARAAQGSGDLVLELTVEMDGRQLVPKSVPVRLRPDDHVANAE